MQGELNSITDPTLNQASPVEAIFLMKLKIALLVWLLSDNTFAFDNLNGSNGVSGMTFTPTATIAKGIFDFQYMNSNIGIQRHDGFNFSSTFGLSDFLEVGGRLSANTWTTNSYSGDSGNRDLSASGKFQLNSLFNLQSFPLKAAIGTTDYGGAATFYRSDYGVATLDSENYQLSLGYAKATSNVAYNTISGLFGSVAAALRPWYAVRLENSDKGVFAGMTFSNEDLAKRIEAPNGAKFYANVDSQLSGQSVFGKKPVLSVGLRLPLDGTLGPETKVQLLGKSKVDDSNAENLKPTSSTAIPNSNTFLASVPQFFYSQKKSSGPLDAQHAELNINSTVKNKDPIEDKSIASSVPKSNDSFVANGSSSAVRQTNVPWEKRQASNPSSIQDADLKDLSANLAKSMGDHGFESINVGLDGRTLVIEFSDFVFDHSNLDGAGVALGVLSQTSVDWAKNGIKDYRLVLSKWGTPSIGFSGELECLAHWLDALSCPASTALKPQVRGLQAWVDSANWQIAGYRSYRFKPRIKVNPVQNYYVGTEFGVFDYSIGYEAQVAVPLWKGGLIEYSEVSPLKSMGNYSDGQIFAYTRVRHGVEHTLLHHMQRLGGGFSVRGTAGQLFTGQFKGYQGEVRWESVDGEIETGLTSSYWRASPDAGFTQNVGKPTVTFARYAPKGQDWSFELDMGEYWYHDKGASIMSNVWFGDTMLSLYVRRSVPPEAYWPGPLGVTFAGFNLSFPLTPRKAMNPDFFQVKGASQYGFNLGTPVGRKDNYIVGSNGVPIYIKALVDAPVVSFLATDVLDHDRMNLSYIPEHLDRIRYAYLRWVKLDSKLQ